MSAKLRVAAVGAGYFSQFQVRAWARMDDVERVGIRNRTAAKAEKIAKAHDIPAMYRLRRNRPVWVSKPTPSTITSDRCRQADADGSPSVPPQADIRTSHFDAPTSMD